MTQTYTARNSAIRAARETLKKGGNPAPISGVHFRIVEVDDHARCPSTGRATTLFTWEAIDVASGETRPGGDAAQQILGAPRAAKDAKPAAPTRSAAAKAQPGKRKAAEEAAAHGEMPSPPNFSAKTHASYRKPLARCVELIEARDIAGLRAMQYRTNGSSGKALDRFRLLAITALETRAPSA